MMSERCPLSVNSGFYYDEDIPEICRQTCEKLWDLAIKSTQPSHEEYPDYLLSYPECPHPSTEFGNASLQSIIAGAALRLYGTTERCMSCNDEIAEDSYEFSCPNS